jgi:hypothetical protein
LFFRSVFTLSLVIFPLPVAFFTLGFFALFLLLLLFFFFPFLFLKSRSNTERFCKKARSFLKKMARN